MRFLRSFAFFIAILPCIDGQIFMDSSGDYICPNSTLNLNFCLSGPIMLVCTKVNVIVDGFANCADRLAGVYPGGIKDSASCWQPPNPLKDGSAACSWNGKVYPDDGPAFPLPKSYTQITPNYTCLPSAGSYYEGKTNIEDLLASTVPCSARSAESSSSKLQSTTSLPRNISSHISSRISSRISSQNHNYNQSIITTSTAQTKPLNHTIAFPPFVLLSTNPASECDLFGPLCQTGSIAAKVELTGTTITTTVPCSDYLRAQSAYFLSQNYQTQATGLDLFQSFRRSPQCTSIADHELSEPFTNCDPSLNLTSYEQFDSYVPYGVTNISFPISCCGYCQMIIPQVQVFYWDTDVVGNCSQNTEISTSKLSNSTSRAPSLQKRAHSLLGDTAVIDGYTFTSPSIYLVITGTAAISDYCGQVGPEYTGLTVAIPPGGLSTLSYDLPVGASIRNVSDGYTKRLDPRDLQCPKWGVEKPNGGLGGWIVGPPFMPIILAPPELQSLNTDWAQCTYATNRGWIVTYGIFDPPRILTPAAPDLIESLTQTTNAVVTTSQTPESTGTEARPAGQISGSSAKATHSAAVDPFPTPSPSSNRPPSVVPGPIKATPNSVLKADPKKHDPSSHGAVEDPPSSDPTGSDPVDPDKPEPVKHDPSDIASLGSPPFIDPGQSDPLNPDRHGSANQGSHIKSSQGVVPADTKPKINVGADGPHTTINIGGVVFTAFEKARPSQAPGSKSAEADPILGEDVPFTTVNIGGTIYSAFGETKPLKTAGATATGGEVNEDNNDPHTTVNLGKIIFGAFGEHTPIVHPSIFTIGGSKITANPSGLYFDGTTLSKGHPAITVAGTPISVGPSDIMIGSERVTFAPTDPINTGRPIPSDPSSILTSPDLKDPTSPDPVITEDGQKITVIDPSAIGIDGITLSANAPATTISGVVYSIDSSGGLAVNDHNTDKGSAGTPALVSSSITVDGVAITEKPGQVVVGGKTLTPGGSPIMISGTPILLNKAGVLIVGTSTIELPQMTSPPAPALIPSTLTVDKLKITEKPDQVIIGGLTLTPGGSAVTISGTPISLGSSGNLVVGSSTIPLPQITSPPTLIQSTLTFDNFKITEQPNKILIDGSTLTPGQPAITISGTRLSLNPSNNHLIIGSSTIPLSLPKTPSTLSLSLIPSTLTFENLKITEKSEEILVAGSTLTPGEPAITISGTRVALDRSGILVVGTATVDLEKTTSSSSGDGSSNSGSNVNNNSQGTASPSAQASSEARKELGSIHLWIMIVFGVNFWFWAG